MTDDQAALVGAPFDPGNPPTEIRNIAADVQDDEWATDGLVSPIAVILSGFAGAQAWLKDHAITDVAPKTGFNVVGTLYVDRTAVLYLIAHCETLVEAYAIAYDSGRMDEARVYESGGKERYPHDFCGGTF